MTEQPRVALREPAKLPERAAALREAAPVKPARIAGIAAAMAFPASPWFSPRLPAIRLMIAGPSNDMIVETRFIGGSLSLIEFENRHAVG